MNKRSTDKSGTKEENDPIITSSRGPSKFLLLPPATLQLPAVRRDICQLAVCWRCWIRLSHDETVSKAPVVKNNNNWMWRVYIRTRQSQGISTECQVWALPVEICGFHMHSGLIQKEINSFLFFFLLFWKNYASFVSRSMGKMLNISPGVKAFPP